MAEIIADLTADAQAGSLPPVKIGWPGAGRKPANAADIADETVMAWWRSRAFAVFVRVSADGAQTITRERAEVKARPAKLEAKVEP